MPIEMSPERVRAMRLRAQHLFEKAPLEDTVELVRSLCGVNAQLRPAMLLALRARIRDLQPEDVATLTAGQPKLVRTWAMRSTIHLLAREDAGWMTGLLGPALLPRLARRRRELGLDDEKLARGLQELQAILGEGYPLTRGEVVDRLIDRGLALEKKSQAPYHLLVYAGLRGLILIGPDSPDGETYVLAAEEQRQPEGEQALAELAYRYLQGYGPASPADFAAWSGLPAKVAKKSWELLAERGSLAEIRVENRALWAEQELTTPEKEAFPEPVVNLLPAFDTLVLGYADRGYVVPEKYHREVYHGGQTVPVVMVNGLAAGVWRYERRGKRVDIEVCWFEPIDRKIKELTEKEAEDIERLFGLSRAVGQEER